MSREAQHSKKMSFLSKIIYRLNEILIKILIFFVQLYEKAQALEYLKQFWKIIIIWKESVYSTWRLTVAIGTMGVWCGGGIDDKSMKQNKEPSSDRPSQIYSTEFFQWHKSYSTQEA